MPKGFKSIFAILSDKLTTTGGRATIKLKLDAPCSYSWHAEFFSTCTSSFNPRGVNLDSELYLRKGNLYGALGML
ncbi:unnamed protein product [Ectocarpus sp. CCAP 1310/34]|nr:unnamed protein product [Ectocarpus sp. CCAP 1310/34]